MIYLESIEIDTSESENMKQALPKTVDEAVDILLTKLSLRDKTVIANMTEADLNFLHSNSGAYIRNEFGLCDGNEDLMQSSCSVSGKEGLHPDETSMIIIKELWKTLGEVHL